MNIDDKELMNVYGGAITASYLNALARIYNTVLGIGQLLGTAIRRSINGSYCKV